MHEFILSYEHSHPFIDSGTGLFKRVKEFRRFWDATIAVYSVGMAFPKDDTDMEHAKGALEQAHKEITGSAVRDGYINGNIIYAINLRTEMKNEPAFKDQVFVEISAGLESRLSRPVEYYPEISLK